MTQELQNTPEANATVEPTRSRRTVAPRADIFENDTAVTLVADMPGGAPEDLTVTLEENELKLVGRVSYAALEGFALRYAEFEPADYERTFVISERVDASNITATLKNGQLHLTVPKLAPVQKEIPVTAG